MVLEQLWVVELAVEDAELDVARAAELVVDTCAQRSSGEDGYAALEDARCTNGEGGAPTTTQPAAMERTIML